MTVEELLLDASFVDYCLDNNSVHREKWEQLRSSDPEIASTMDEARQLLSAIGPELPASEVAAEVEKFRQLFLSRSQERLPMEPTPTKKTSRRTWVSAAIAASIVLAAFIFWPRSVEKQTPLVLIEHHTGFGERLQVLLPDGSKVILNSNSHLQYQTDFNQKERRLELLGEAYFEVAGNPSKKFIVSSGKFSSTAIGTAFYVHGRQSSQSYSVNLLEGKLRVQNDSGSPSLLEAGQQAAWRGNQNAFTINRFDTASLKQWIDGRLSFQHTDAREVLRQLAEWYAVEIVDVRKKPGTITITGDYHNKPLEDILKAICFSLSCQYTITGNKIVIQ